MTFDPYHRWLGIPPQEQPADYYRLLGIARFESNPDVIQEAADRQMAHVKTHVRGPQAAESQRLLNELAAARLCLLHPAEKRSYDERLKSAPRSPARRSFVAADRRLQLILAGIGGAVVGLVAMAAVAVMLFRDRGERPAAAGDPAAVASDSTEGAAATGESTNATAVEPLGPPPPASAAPGLVAELFEGAELERPVARRNDPHVNWLWASEAPDVGLPGDYFSARWTGFLKAPEPGAYTLVLAADHGARLWLDEQPVIDAWTDTKTVYHEAAVELSGQPQAVRIEYHEIAGEAFVGFRWIRPGRAAEEEVPTWALFQDVAAAQKADVVAAAAYYDALADSPGAGLLRQVFRGRKMLELLGDGTDDRIDRLLPAVKPEEQFPAGSLGIRWRGSIRAPRPGMYRLVAVADDGVRVWIDGKLRIDAWRVGRLSRHMADVPFDDGPHLLRVDYFRENAGGLVSLRWLPPDGVEQVVPPEFLSHEVAR